MTALVRRAVSTAGRRPVQRKRAGIVRVRHARAGDLAVIVELRLALLDAHRSCAIYGRVRADAVTLAPKAVARQLASPRDATFLAERGRTVVGMLRCSERRSAPLLYPSRFGYISSVFVRPDARRGGVLLALLDAATEWCRARSLAELRLYSSSDTDLSNAVWDKLGFRIVEYLRLRPLSP